MPRRAVFHGRGRVRTVSDNDRSMSFGRRHYSAILKMNGRPDPMLRPLYDPLPDPPTELYYCVLWLRHSVKKESLRSLQRLIRKRMFILDKAECLILIENIRYKDSAQTFFFREACVCNEYRAVDLPFANLPEQFH